MANLARQTTFSSLLTLVHSNTTDTNSSSPLTNDFNTTTLQLNIEDGDVFDPFNNPWNLISAATRKTFVQLIDNMYIMFFIVGVPANVINCLVFYRQVCSFVLQCNPFP